MVRPYLRERARAARREPHRRQRAQPQRPLLGRQAHRHRGLCRLHGQQPLHQGEPSVVGQVCLGKLCLQPALFARESARLNARHVRDLNEPHQRGHLIDHVGGRRSQRGRHAARDRASQRLKLHVGGRRRVGQLFRHELVRNEGPSACHHCGNQLGPAAARHAHQRGRVRERAHRLRQTHERRDRAGCRQQALQHDRRSDRRRIAHPRHRARQNQRGDGAKIRGQRRQRFVYQKTDPIRVVQLADHLHKHVLHRGQRLAHGARRRAKLLRDRRVGQHGLHELLRRQLAFHSQFAQPADLQPELFLNGRD